MRRKENKLVPAYCIFRCTGPAPISTEPPTELWIFNILKQNHNPFRSFPALEIVLTRKSPSLGAACAAALLQAGQSMTSPCKRSVQPWVLRGSSSRKCHQASGKAGLPQALSSPSVTPFRRALTTCKTFFPLSLTNLAMEFLENKLSLNKGFKLHPFRTCVASKLTVGKMCALWTSADPFFILNLAFKLTGKSTPGCTLCSSCFPCA